MEIFGGLLHGFALALQPVNLFWCFVGCALGTVVGIMPGLGPPATIAMLLPLTFLMNPASAMIMLAGIYYGAKYGGSTTSILLNVPGESASIVTCLDGYQMAKKGRAGAALGIAAIASFVAGTVGVLGLMLVAPPLAKDRKSTRLNSSHSSISYAVFCLKKKKERLNQPLQPPGVTCTVSRRPQCPQNRGRPSWGPQPPHSCLGRPPPVQ